MIRRTHVLALGLAVAALCLVPRSGAEAQVEPMISWKVENPFRFFRDVADTEAHRATYEALSADEKRTPVLSAERALSPRHPDGWAATMYERVCWDTNTNTHACPRAGEYINPKAHVVLAGIAGIEDADIIGCTWLTAPLGGGKLRGDVMRQPCRDRVRFEIPYPHGAMVQVEIGGQIVAETRIIVEDLLIAGMGDSFASGEGNPDLPVRFSRERAAEYGKAELTGYPARTGTWRRIGDRGFQKGSARWLDQACHRSLYSHQLRAALQLAIEDPHRAVTFVGAACAGAEITTGVFLRYGGNEWVPFPPDLSQISSIAEAQCGSKNASAEDLPEAYHMRGAIPELKGGLVLRKCPVEDSRKIDLVFLSVGGNDVGFSRIVANAVLADQSILKKLGGWIGSTIEQREASHLLSTLDTRYKSLNRALHNVLHVPWNENDRVIITAYPGIALLGDGSETCPDGYAGMEILPDFKLSELKVREGVWLADKLHRSMKASAGSHGWTLADSHRQGFIGRGICAGFTDSAFSIADDLRLPRKVDGKWQPYNPADYKAYASRQRWFRTPNDAFLTANFHVPHSLLDKVLKLESLSWFQLVLASTYSGAFHPTAEGQAAIADAVVVKARGVLARYAPKESGVSQKGASNQPPSEQKEQLP